VKLEYSTDDDDYQSTSSSEMVLYPENRFDILKIFPFPLQNVRPYEDMHSQSFSGLMTPQRWTLREIILSIVLLIIFYKAGLNQIQDFTGQLSALARNLETQARGIEIFSYNIQQMTRDSSVNSDDLYPKILPCDCQDHICGRNDKFSATSQPPASSEETAQDISESHSIVNDQKGMDVTDIYKENAVLPMIHGTETGTEQHVSGMNIAFDIKASKARKSLRDRVDHFLGWKGPLDSR
jgi:hypothetical protein